MLNGSNIFSVFIQSPTMVILMLCSVTVVAFSLERWWYFYRSGVGSRSFVATMDKQLRARRIDEFAKFCGSGRSYLGRIMGVAVENIEMEREELEQVLDLEMEKEQIQMEKNLVVLGTLANIAPLLGLFGTVVGIIRAFRDISVTGSGGSSVIAMGVAEALLTTAAGIVVAVLATVFYNIFMRKIRVRTIEVEGTRSRFWQMLSPARSHESA